jgi:hypothetical protein
MERACPVLNELQRDVDARVESYNTERVHSGNYCYGKTPIQTFVHSAKLAHARQLDRIQPTTGPVAAVA